MRTSVSNLAELRRFLKPDVLPPWHQHIVQRELNGGHTSVGDLDQILPSTTTLTVSGLDQTALEHLAERFGRQLTGLHLWKCPRVADLSPLERFPQLTHVAIFWNQRSTRLWNLGLNPQLRALHFTDFIKMDSLDDLAGAAGGLQDLEFGNANFSQFIVQTLEPLSALRHLQGLRFNAKKIIDGRIQPLAKLAQLTTLEFPSSQFTVAQIAWLRSKLPASVVGASLAPLQRLAQPIRRGAKELDVLVNGKKMPFLSSTLDAKRINQYVDAFDELVVRFSANPSDEPTA